MSGDNNRYARILKQRVVVVLKAICLVIVLALLRPIEHLCRAIWSGCKALWKDLIDVKMSPLASKQEIEEHVEYLKYEWRKDVKDSSSGP